MYILSIPIYNTKCIFLSLLSSHMHLLLVKNLLIKPYFRRLRMLNIFTEWQGYEQKVNHRYEKLPIQVIPEHRKTGCRHGGNPAAAGAAACCRFGNPGRHHRRQDRQHGDHRLQRVYKDALMQTIYTDIYQAEKWFGHRRIWIKNFTFLHRLIGKTLGVVKQILL